MRDLGSEHEYLSECCDAFPTWELDMSTAAIKGGGPSGFCSRCLDNAIFFLSCSKCGSINQVRKINSQLYGNILVCIDCSKEEVGVS